jgi:hypothetical protein
MMMTLDVEDEEEYRLSYPIIHEKDMIVKSSYVWYMYIHCMHGQA